LITFDLQQTHPLPKLSTSKAYYLCQIWLYNLGWWVTGHKMWQIVSSAAIHCTGTFYCRTSRKCVVLQSPSGDSVNVQYMTDCHGLVHHIVTGLSGSTHNKTAAAWSLEPCQLLDNLLPSHVMLGDPAYRGNRKLVRYKEWCVLLHILFRAVSHYSAAYNTTSRSPTVKQGVWA